MICLPWKRPRYKLTYFGLRTNKHPYHGAHGTFIRWFQRWLVTLTFFLKIRDCRTHYWYVSSRFWATFLLSNHTLTSKFRPGIFLPPVQRGGGHGPSCLPAVSLLIIQYHFKQGQMFHSSKAVREREKKYKSIYAPTQKKKIIYFNIPNLFFSIIICLK